MLKAILLCCWLPTLALLAGCSSLGYERQALTEITGRYGGECFLKRGYNLTARAGAPRGSYLEINLRSPGLRQRYASLALPAAGCAFLVYHGLAAAAPDRYAYYVVRLTDADTTRTYTYQAPELALAEQAADHLVTLVADWQQHEFLAAAATFEPTALGAVKPDSLLPLMMRTAQELAPLTRYTIEAFEVVDTTLASKPSHLVKLLASVPRPAGPGFFQVVINPATAGRTHFLYGLALLH